MLKTKLESIVGLELYFKAHPDVTDACIELPFRCHYCQTDQFDFEMVNGDGQLMCNECFEGFVSILSAEPAGPRPHDNLR